MTLPFVFGVILGIPLGIIGMCLWLVTKLR